MAVESGARVSKTLSGDLRSRPLAVLLAGACERGTSGTFTFRHGGCRSTLTLRAGKIAGVFTHQPIAYLGGILYEQGAIDVATLDESLRAVALLRRLHGEILLERGAVTRERLDEGLAEQTFRKVHHLFSLPEDATWAFRDDVDDLAGERDDGRPAIDTWTAIWRGLRDQPIAEHVHRTLAKIDGTIHLRDLATVDRFGFAPEEYAICERLAAEPATLEQVLATSLLVPERTTLLVYLLALARCIVRVATQPVGPAELGIEGVRARARQIDNEEPHTTLGLREGATTEAARAAYFRLARLWHPDKIPAELAEVRAECEHVLARLSVAHRLLSPPLSMPPGTNGSVRPGAPSIAPPTGDLAARRWTMRDVDIALALGDLSTAEAQARTLVTAGADGPAARAVLVWCGIGAGTIEAPEALERAHAALERILTGDPDCTRALFYRGQVARRLGHADAASRDFRKVVRLDPRHLDAQREVRLGPVPRPPSGSTPHDGKPKAPHLAPPTTSSSPPEAPRLGVDALVPPRAGERATPDDAAAASGLRRLLERVIGK